MNSQQYWPCYRKRLYCRLLKVCCILCVFKKLFNKDVTTTKLADILVLFGMGQHNNTATQKQSDVKEHFLKMSSLFGCTSVKIASLYSAEERSTNVPALSNASCLISFNYWLLKTTESPKYTFQTTKTLKTKRSNSMNFYFGLKNYLSACILCRGNQQKTAQRKQYGMADGG